MKADLPNYPDRTRVAEVAIVRDERQIRVAGRGDDQWGEWIEVELQFRLGTGGASDKSDDFFRNQPVHNGRVDHFIHGRVSCLCRRLYSGAQCRWHPDRRRAQPCVTGKVDQGRTIQVYGIESLDAHRGEVAAQPHLRAKVLAKIA